MKRPKILLLIRHGQNTNDDHSPNSELILSEEGINQALWAKEIISYVSDCFDVTFSSTSRRAMQTAQIICAERNKKCEVAKIEKCPELTGCGGGNLEGKPYSRWYAIPTKDLWRYGVESYTSQTERMGRMVERLLNNHKKNDNIIIVSHASVYQVLFALISGIADEKTTFELTKPAPANYHILTL